MKLNVVLRHKRHKHGESILHDTNEIAAESSYSEYYVMNIHGEKSQTDQNQLTGFAPADIMKKKKEVYKINEEGEIETIKQKDGKTKEKAFSLFDLNHIGIGYNLVIPLLLGVLLGLFLDNFLKTGSHFFTAIFILLGLLSSLFNLFKLAKTKKENAAH